MRFIMRRETDYVINPCHRCNWVYYNQDIKLLIIIAIISRQLDFFFFGKTNFCIFFMN